LGIGIWAAVGLLAVRLVALVVGVVAALGLCFPRSAARSVLWYLGEGIGQVLRLDLD